jgi:hypothetical protein
MNLSMILNRQYATVSVINNVAAGAVSTDVQGGMACRHAPYISLLPRRLLRNSATVYLDPHWGCFKFESKVTPPPCISIVMSLQVFEI